MNYDFELLGLPAGYCVALCLAIVCAGVYCLPQYCRNKWRGSNVPHVRPWPVFGNTFKLFARLEHQMETYDRMYKRFAGETLCGFHQMNTPYLMIRDPGLITRIMVTDFSSFTDHGVHLDPATDVLANSLFFLSGRRWKTMRDSLGAGFSPARLRGAHGLINGHAERLTACIGERSKAAGGGDPVVDVRQIAGRYATDVLGTWAFGLELDTVGNRNLEFREHAKKLFRSGYGQLLVQILLSVCPRAAKFFKLQLAPKDSSKFFYATFDNVIRYRDERNVIRNDLTQTLISARKELVLNAEKNSTDENKFTDADIVNNAILIFVSGSGTVSSTLTFCFYELALNKHVQNKLREEIITKKKIHGGQFNREFSTNLPYANMVLDEIARMYSVGCTILREATKNYYVPEKALIIEKGQKIIIPMYNIHNDPKYYPNPKIFDPERFSIEQTSKRMNGTFLPYGDGPRMCLGRRFAELEMILVLSNVLSKYEVLPCEKTEIPLDIRSGSGFISPKNEIWLSFKPIVSSN